LARVLSGVVAVPIVLGIVLYGSSWLFLALLLVAVLIGCREYFSMISHTGTGGFPILAAVLSFLLITCFYFEGRYFSEWGVVATVSLFVAWFVTGRSVQSAIDNVSYTLLGVVYVAALAGYYLLILDLEGGRKFVVFVFFICWSSDIAAYYGGKRFGKTPLAPNVSPNKTIEGSIFGLAGSLLVAGLSSQLFLQEIPLVHCLIVGIFCGIIGQFGDLVESLLKRNAGVKDSGSLIPGHGGVLDRIDSLLFAGPALYLYYKMFF